MLLALLLVAYFSFPACGQSPPPPLGPSSSSAPWPVPSLRSSSVESFKVMDVMAAALKLEEQGESIIHLEVGQPSTGAPRKVLQAASAALESDRIGYTSAMGLDALRERIVKHYADSYKVDICKSRVIITTGSSAGFLFAFLGCFDPSAHVGLCSSGYPCYRNDMKALGLNEVSIPVNAQYKVTAVELEREIIRRRDANVAKINGFICSSPSNPTGAMLTPSELSDICKLCDKHGIVFISDEIYHGIAYGAVEQATAAQFSANALVINSFSKYYSMTGWRLGWMVVPASLVDTMNRLSQNLYINAPTLSQLAGIAAFDCSEELDSHVRKYADNREIVLSTLSELGLLSGASPSDGAFYIYLDLNAHLPPTLDTPTLCRRLLNEAKIAVTPGVDFEFAESGLGNRRIRFSFSRSTNEVREGMIRFKKWWLANMSPSQE